jgi:hypothetical protein
VRAHQPRRNVDGGEVFAEGFDAGNVVAEDFDVVNAAEPLDLREHVALEAADSVGV